MNVHFDGQDYEFELDNLDVMEARTIKRQTGLTPRDMYQGMAELDPDALVAIYWLMMKQNGKTVDVSKVNFNLIEFAAAVTADETEDEPDEVDPTAEVPATSSV